MEWSQRNGLCMDYTEAHSVPLCIQVLRTRYNFRVATLRDCLHLLEWISSLDMTITDPNI